MPGRGITLGPRSGAPLTHGARRPERRHFFDTHKSSPIDSAPYCTPEAIVGTIRHAGQERQPVGFV